MGKDSRFLAGFDLGGTKMMAGVLNDKMEVLSRSKKKTRGKSEEGDTFKRIADCIRDACKEANVDPKDLAGIGVGSPGPLDPVTGVIGETVNLPTDLREFPLKARLEKEFGCPAEVDNDVNMGTLGEFAFGAAKKGRNVLGVFPGTGIGGGLIIEGQLFRGSSGAAGEVGHVVMDPAGPRCGCGKRGCLEAYASRLAIVARALVLLLRGEAPALAKEVGLNPGDIKSSALARAIEGGDKLLEEAIRETAFRVDTVIGSLINVISPDTVVLGGGLVEAMPALYVEEVTAGAKKAALGFLFKDVRIVTAKLGDDAVMMGAASLIATALAAKEKPKDKS
ncbi:MAG TPA: ROK family protein [Candidatus Brocadiia bacterium]|nr:ROK family protein [Candidatus Brocadiia bacterium]